MNTFLPGDILEYEYTHPVGAAVYNRHGEITNAHWPVKKTTKQLKVISSAGAPPNTIYVVRELSRHTTLPTYKISNNALLALGAKHAANAGNRSNDVRHVQRDRVRMRSSDIPS